MEVNLKTIKHIIGLGNPELRYEDTYHNVGHLFIDYVQQFEDFKSKAIKSESYMNESGKFVVKTIKGSAHPEELLIVQDDSDIEIGKYKFTAPGHGSAGHHGIESIQQQLKSKKFWRLRIGIRPKQTEGETRIKAEEFVLKKISPADQKLLEKVFEEAKIELTK